VLFPDDREGLRRMYAEAWARHRAGRPLEPLQAQIADVILEHPEYATLVEQGEDALLREWGPDGGAVNPFLHMGMHLALREQVATDRPAGVAAIHRRLSAAHGPHEAEHRMMECLGEALWLAQRSGVMPDERAYLEALRRLPG
jgi:hypothetical protein